MTAFTAPSNPGVSYPPNTIRLAGQMDLPSATLLDQYAALPATIKPGFLVELVNDSGTPKWQPHSSATSQCPMFVALEDSIFGGDQLAASAATNRGSVDYLYAAGEIVPVWALRTGFKFWGLIPSGQNVTVGDALQSNGDGKLKAATASTAAAGVYRFQAIETTGAVTVDTRVVVQVVG